MVDRIACFLTCGYTEAGAMQSFLHKINCHYEFRQFLPNKTIKKKGMPKNISNSLSGLTGNSLLKKIYEIIEKHKDEINVCKAIIIEDDLDGKFHGWNDAYIQNYKDSIVNKIHGILKNELPVFILYASPEVESWFIADWYNGFGFIYSNKNIPDVEKGAIAYFNHQLKQYINRCILNNYAANIEEYGYFKGKYYKLSDQLINAIQVGVKKYINDHPKGNKEYKQQIMQSRYLYYSKKLHGDKMLRNINPETVANRCKKYFKPVYNKLCSF